MQISDSDKQNKILQLQIDIMMKKMEILEGFMTQVKEMDEEVSVKDTKHKEQQPQLCHKCRKRIDSSAKAGVTLDDVDVSDDEEVDVKDVLKSVGWAFDSESGEDDNIVQHKNPMMIDIVSLNINYKYNSIFKDTRIIYLI